MLEFSHNLISLVIPLELLFFNFLFLLKLLLLLHRDHLSVLLVHFICFGFPHVFNLPLDFFLGLLLSFDHLLVFLFSLVDVWLGYRVVLFQEFSFLIRFWKFFRRLLQLLKCQKLVDSGNVDALTWLLVFCHQNFSQI